MRSLLLLVPVSLLIGCSSPVGTYRVDGAEIFEISCSGGDSARTGAWIDALSADVATDMQVGSKDDEVQAQLQRSDGSVIYAPVTDDGDNSWSGVRTVEATTTTDALLGSDFSGLLEGDGICVFDYTVDVDLDFGAEGYDAVSARFRATLDESAGATPCDIQTCTVEFGVGAAKTSSVNPGVQEDAGAD